MLQRLIQNDLAVYSSHLPLDAHPRLGNNAQLCAALGFKNLKPFFLEKGRHIGWQTRDRIPRQALVERLAAVLGRAPLLLPGGGELGPRCSCPDDADPCKHSAAACYLLTDALDTDPFALFLLRGRTRDQVLAGIRTHRRGVASGQASASEAGTAGQAGAETPSSAGRSTADPGVDARTAFAAPTPSAPIPAVPLPPGRPGLPAALPVDPPPWRSGLRDDLLELAADAACRSWELATGLSADAGLNLDPDDDLARRAARALGTPTFAVLAARSGIHERDLARQALAWRQGGMTGLESLRAEWDPAAEDPDALELLTAARAALRTKTGAAEAVHGNQVTAGNMQLRLGRDLRWYPYTRSDEGWEPGGSPETDPARAVADL